MVAVKSKKVVAISRRNGGDDVKSSSFYEQLMVLEKKSDGDNTTNYCVMRKNVCMIDLSKKFYAVDAINTDGRITQT